MLVHGTKDFENGDTYDGELVRNRADKLVPNGRGVMQYACGDRYEGGWHDGLRHGDGVLTVKRTGRRLSGRFAAGALPKQGELRLPGARLYRGALHDGLPHGVGCFEWQQQGDMYRGCFENGRRNGQGTLSWADTKESYSGSWTDDEPFGTGDCHYRYAKGERYEGGWDNGRHGDGAMRYPDGRIVRGKFQRDALPRIGCVIMPSGEKYEGPLQDGQPCGQQASYSWPQYKVTYRGAMCAGRPHGQGRCDWPAEGLQYVGQVSKDDIGLRVARARALLE
ncbi:MAG: hypothetical protein EOO40_02520, partial [Deltaproteobacteria bacterium]